MSKIKRGGEIRRFKAAGGGQKVTIIEYFQFEEWVDSDSDGFKNRKSVASGYETSDDMNVERIAQSDEYMIRDLGNLIVKEVPDE